MEHDSDSSDEESLALKRRKLASSTLRTEIEKEKEKLHHKEEEEDDDDDNDNNDEGDDERDDERDDDDDIESEISEIIFPTLSTKLNRHKEQEEIHRGNADVDSILSLVGAPSRNVKKKKKCKRVHRHLDPNLPRRPRSPFMFFLKTKGKEVYEQILSEGKKPSYPRMFQKASTMWRRLTFEERIPYNELAIEDKIRYNEEMTNYHPRDPDLIFGPDTSDSDFEDVDLSDSDYDLPDGKRILQDTYRDLFYKIKNVGPRSRFGLNAPRNIKAAYPIFFDMNKESVGKELQKKNGSAISMKLIFDEVASRWRKLPKEEKKQLKILERADMVRYRRELAEYKKKMAARKAAMEQAKRDGVEYVEEVIYNYT